ncbi:ubiquitin-conjugating enzyme E2 [Plasmodium gonderi]|uniref:Ubiquitin-conjugating enzyme E2 n=1 Tax=Plasmodium gonderi TaxID=77519 RepID=A0A1Y1JMW4_PLAGO|nr:ubiquitin-conjugating enzyme E2 [Plasmodium gonderi]GAW83801.1 ubiquitin-conjugating enzyme E2 [Plasmodium gonderi]
MWYDNERVPEEEGVSKLLIGKTLAYFPKYAEDEDCHMLKKKEDEEELNLSYKEGKGNYERVKPKGDNDNGGIEENMDTIEKKMNSSGNTDNLDTIEDMENGNSGCYQINETIQDDIEIMEGVDSVIFNEKEYILVEQRLGRTIIPLNPELLSQSTLEQDIIDGYLSEIHKNVHKYSILTEYSFLVNEIPRGFYCLPQHDNLLIWDVFIILYSTVYKNGKFKVQIKLGENHPHSIPEVFFLSPVFHPLINPKTGKLNLGNILNQWTPSCHYMSLIFLYIKNIFYLQDEYTKDIIENDQAHFLLNSDKELFLHKVHECIEQSNYSIYQQVNNCMFNFDTHLASQEITDMLHKVKKDPLCHKKAEAFIHWLINDYSSGGGVS